MSKIIPIGLATLLVMLSPLPAAASTSAELNVSGTILPAACAVRLPQGTVLDFGDMPTVQLPDGRIHFDGSKQVPLAIDCSAKQRFGLLFKDLGHAAALPAKHSVLVLKDGTDDVVGLADIRLHDAVADGGAETFRQQGGTTDPRVLLDDPAKLMVVGWKDEAFKSVAADMTISIMNEDGISDLLKEKTTLKSRIGIELVYL